MVYLHLKFWEHPVIRWCFRCSFAAPTLEPPFSLHCVMIRSLWVKRWEGHDVPSFRTSNTKHPKKSIQQKQHGFLASSSQSKIPWNKLAACHFCSKLDTHFFMLSFNSRNIFSAPPKNYIRFIGLTLSSTLGGFCSIHIMTSHRSQFCRQNWGPKTDRRFLRFLDPWNLIWYHHQASPKLP